MFYPSLLSLIIFLYKLKNSLPSSTHSYSSGGEDGYVRIHYFDPHYFDFELEA